VVIVYRACSTIVVYTLSLHDALPISSLIEADVPMIEMHDFATLVRQMTQGSGSFTFVFERYEQLPNQLAADVIAQARAISGEERSEEHTSELKSRIDLV